MLADQFNHLVQRALDEIRAHYGPRLVSMVLFGSVARGTQRHDSDVDLLLVCRDLPRGRMKRVAEFDGVEAKLEPDLLALQAAGVRTSLSAIFRTPEEVSRGSLLYLDMVGDAKILFDEGGFFAAFLEELRGKLRALGSQRIRRGNAWYWVLTDLKPGEVFEL